MTPLFTIDGCFPQSPMTVQESSSESDFEEYEDDQDTISLVGVRKTANTMQSSVFGGVQETVDHTEASDTVSQFDPAVSQIYEARDFQQPQVSPLDDRRRNSLQNSPQDEAIQDALPSSRILSKIHKSKKGVSGVPRSIQPKSLVQEEISVVTAPKSIHTKNMEAVETSVVRTPHRSKVAQAARKNGSEGMGISTALPQIEESPDGHFESSSSSSSSETPSRSQKDQPLSLPETHKDFLRTEDIHSVEGYEITLMDTREDESERERRPKRFSLFRWSKGLRRREASKHSDVENRQSASGSSSEGSRSRLGNDDVETETRKLSDEHRQDVAARMRQRTRTVILKSSHDKDDSSRAAAEASTLVVDSEDSKDLSSEINTRIPTVLPRPVEKEKKYQMKSTSSSKQITNFQGGQSKRGILKITGHVPSSRGMTRAYVGSNLEASKTKTSLSPMPRSILKMKNILHIRNGIPIEKDLSLVDESVGIMGQNALVESATVPHSFSCPKELEGAAEANSQKKFGFSRLFKKTYKMTLDKEQGITKQESEKSETDAGRDTLASPPHDMGRLSFASLAASMSWNTSAKGDKLAEQPGPLISINSTSPSDAELPGTPVRGNSGNVQPSSSTQTEQTSKPLTGGEMKKKSEATEKKQLSKTTLVFKTQRSQRGGKNLSDMVKKIKAEKLMAHQSKSSTKESFSGRSTPPTRSPISADSSKEDTKLLSMWNSPVGNMRWNMTDEKRMLRVVSRVVKRRLQALELLKKDTAITSDEDDTSPNFNPNVAEERSGWFGFRRLTCGALPCWENAN
jgi:hypothetical protein